MTSNPTNSNEEKDFGEFRRKVKSAEVLSDCLAKMLLDRLRPPVRAQVEEETNETTVVQVEKVENGGEPSTPGTEPDASLGMKKSET